MLVSNLKWRNNVRCAKWWPPMWKSCRRHCLNKPGQQQGQCGEVKKTVKSLFLTRFQHPTHQIHFFRLAHSIARICKVARGPDFEKSQNRPKSDKDFVQISQILCKLTSKILTDQSANRKRKLCSYRFRQKISNSKHAKPPKLPLNSHFHFSQRL